jgi:glycosyltransferase involved in cell wall biosynthesis
MIKVFSETLSSITVCLVSPMPPPYGGIAHWTKLMHYFADYCDTVDLIQVDVSVRWRSVYDRTVYKRVFGGCLQLVWDFISFCGAILKKPDVIHLTTSGGLGVIRDLVIMISAKLFRVPVIYHIRFGRVPSIADSNTIEWRFLALAMQMATIVIGITPSTVEAIEDHLSAVWIEYIPNPVALSDNLLTENELSHHQRTILYLGWIVPTKGIEELIEAWSAIDHKNWRLVLVGPGEKDYQTELVERYGVADLDFYGELEHEEAMKLMAQCGLFVLPSYTEGFPNVVLEAMSFGRPIIASSVGAIPDMLSDDCGLLVTPKDVEELKVAISKTIDDEDLRRKLGQNARKKARKEYSMDIVFTRYVNVWQNSLISGEV